MRLPENPTPKRLQPSIRRNPNCRSIQRCQGVLRYLRCNVPGDKRHKSLHRPSRLQLQKGAKSDDPSHQKNPAQPSHPYILAGNCVAPGSVVRHVSLSVLREYHSAVGKSLQQSGRQQETLWKESCKALFLFIRKSPKKQPLDSDDHPPQTARTGHPTNAQPILILEILSLRRWRSLEIGAPTNAQI